MNDDAKPSNPDDPLDEKVTAHIKSALDEKFAQLKANDDRILAAIKAMHAKLDELEASWKDNDD